MVLNEMTWSSMRTWPRQGAGVEKARSQGREWILGSPGCSPANRGTLCLKPVPFRLEIYLTFRHLLPDLSPCQRPSTASQLLSPTIIRCNFSLLVYQTLVRAAGPLADTSSLYESDCSANVFNLMRLQHMTLSARGVDYCLLRSSSIDII